MQPSMKLGAGLALALLPAWVAHAELSANVAVTSDYIWHGVSQTNERPALQMGAEYDHESGFYIGTWGSNVDFAEDVADPARVEIDLHGGVRGETECGLGWDFGLLRYMYPRTTEPYDYNELKVSVSYRGITFETDYSDDVFATGKQGFYYYNVGVSHEFPDLFTLSAAVGYSGLGLEVTGDGVPESYVDWRIGVARDIWALGSI
jgi:uncharacterized protein (TIGR02001 family)